MQQNQNSYLWFSMDQRNYKLLLRNRKQVKNIETFTQSVLFLLRLFSLYQKYF